MSNCQVEHLDQLGINRLCLTWPEKAPLPSWQLPTWIPVVCWRYLFPVFPIARRVGPVGRVLKGRAGEAVREERRGPARSSTNRKETETWCGDTTAPTPTPTENRTRLLILSRGGRTHRKSNYPRRCMRLRSTLVLSSEVCADGGSSGRPRLYSPWELIGSFCLGKNVLQTHLLIFTSPNSNPECLTLLFNFHKLSLSLEKAHISLNKSKIWRLNF